MQVAPSTAPVAAPTTTSVPTTDTVDIPASLLPAVEEDAESNAESSGTILVASVSYLFAYLLF
jgi:hypothetical protein